mgnify:CR=1 FL=1
MRIELASEQERLIATEIQAGRYQTAREVVEAALRLLHDRNCGDAEWVESVRSQIDAAIEVSKDTPPIDGESFVNEMLERLEKARQVKESITPP